MKDCFSVLKKHAPGSMQTLKLSSLRGLIISVDVSIFLNKAVKSAGPERWTASFLVLLCTLKRYGIKPLFVFDGPNMPVEKLDERLERRNNQAKTESRLKLMLSLRDRLRKYATPGYKKDPPDELIEEIKNVFGRAKIVEKIIWSDPHSIMININSWAKKIEIQNSPILPIYAEKAKEMIGILGMAYFQAPGEAETLCAAMAVAGLCDAVISEDTDCIVYGTPYLLAKIDLKNGTILSVCLADILEETGLSLEEFVDLCILLKCDYNKRCKGFPPDGKKRKKPAPIGAVAAWDMIRVYRRLEEAEKFIHNPEILKYRRCRELFTPPSKEELSHITVPFNGPIDERKLSKFLKREDCNIEIDYVLQSWAPTELVFGEPTDVESDSDFAFEEE